MKISIKRLCLWIAILAFFLYAFTLGLHSKIYIKSTVTIPLSFIFALIVLKNHTQKQKGNVLLQCCGFLMIIVVVLFNNQNVKHGEYYQLYFSITMILFFIIASKSECWIDIYMKLLSCVGIFYMGTTFVCFISSSFFYNIVVPTFESYGYMEQMKRLYAEGCITGFTPHYSTNAMYLATTLGVFISLLLCRKKKNKIYLFFTIMTIAAIFLTGKRAHAIFGVVAFILAYYFLHSDHPLGRWGKIFLGAVISLGGFVIASEFIPQLMNVINRFVETAASGDIEKGRDALRATALALWKNNLWFGIGWDGFKYYYLLHGGEYVNVHCVFIQLLCECGIIGAVPFYLFFIVSIWRSILTLKNIAKSKIQNEFIRTNMVYAVYIQLFFLMYCFTGNPLYDEPTLLSYIAGCAIGEYYHMKLNDKEYKRMIDKKCK